MNKLPNSIINYFHSLNQLQEYIFFSYGKKKSIIEENDSMQKIHLARVNLFISMKKIRALFREKKQNHSILNKIKNFYEIIFSLNNLNLRVNDNALFEICSAEMQKIARYITYSLQAFQSAQIEQAFHFIKELSLSIDEFTKLYLDMLQVISREPIVFLFFIQDVTALRDEMKFLGMDLQNAILC